MHTVSIDPVYPEKKQQWLAEKAIHEVKIVETNDRYRIEIKGDKGRLREIGFGKAMFGFGLIGRGLRGHHEPSSFDGFP